MAGALQKSTEVMQSMNTLLRVPEIAAAMQDLSKEMMKVGKWKERVFRWLLKIFFLLFFLL